MSFSSIPASALLVATLAVAMGLAAMSPLPSTVPAKAQTPAAASVAAS